MIGRERKILARLVREMLHSKITSVIFKICKAPGCYVCPICDYYGRFGDIAPATGKRKNAQCPKCLSLERHRLQYLVFKEITKGVETKNLKMLHFAPEDCFQRIFKYIFKEYVTVDLDQKGVDFKEDLRRLSFSDDSFDFIYASHVLEHIKEDYKALS